MNDAGTSLRMHTVDPVTQSEVSQEEKNNYHILAHTHGIQKDGTDEPVCGAAIEMQTQNRLVDTVREGEGGTNRAVLKHTRYCMSNREPVGICCMMQGAQTLEGWEEGGGGREGQEGGDVCMPMTDAC